MDSKRRVFLFSRWALASWLFANALFAFPNETLVRGLMNESSYLTAATQLKQLIEKHGLTSEEKTSILWLLGYCQVSLGHNQEAEQTFGQLLRLSPDFYVDQDTSPKIIASFKKARARFIAAHKNDEMFRAAILSQSIKDSLLVIELDVGEAIAATAQKIRIQYRSFEQAAFRSRSFDLTKQSTQTLRIPLASDQESLIYYFVEFVGRYKEVFFSNGSSFNPHSIAVEKSPLGAEKITETPTSFTHLKTGWPMVFAALLAVAGTLTYGLLKLNN